MISTSAEYRSSISTRRFPFLQTTENRSSSTSTTAGAAAVSFPAPSAKEDEKRGMSSLVGLFLFNTAAAGSAPGPPSAFPAACLCRRSLSADDEAEEHGEGDDDGEDAGDRTRASGSADGEEEDASLEKRASLVGENTGEPAMATAQDMARLKIGFKKAFFKIGFRYLKTI